MSNKVKGLVILASDYQSIKFLEFNIRSIFKDVVNVNSYCLKEKNEPINDSSILLTSHSLLIPEAKRLFPNSVIIPGEKTLNGYNLERILHLPEGKKVLVLNVSKAISLEVIQNLLDLGIDHLNYFPFDINNDDINNEYSDIDTAISPGLNHLAPSNIKNIIDIGSRIINITTFLKLLNELELDYSYLKIYMNQYSNLLLRSAQKLASSLDESEKLRKEQEILINEVDYGIALLDRNGLISIINTSLESIFNLNKIDVIGISIKTFFDKIGLMNDSSNNNDFIIDNNIINFNGKDIMCNKVEVMENDTVGYVTFKEVSKVLELEGDIRRKLHKKGYIAKYNFNDIWGSDHKIIETKEQILNFAKTDLAILITGESGTGKELFAQAAHLNSMRKNGPFIAINFAAIPDNLVESELFGYERGAFTGANKEGKSGLFEQAHGGTLFLDEIGDASLNIQVKLLRVLQEKEIMRVGGDNVIPVNVRIIAATNKDLSIKVKEGQFREDLYYRLNVLPVEIPSLRNRKNDISLILNKYLHSKYNTKKTFSSEVIRILFNYSWPGNVRELLNVADYFNYSSKGKVNIEIKDIPIYLKKQQELDKKEIQPVAYPFINIEVTKSKNNMLLILSSFINLGGKNIGRNKLLDDLKKVDSKMTEYKLKKLLKELNDLEYIYVGSTKQGTKITQKGLEFYKNEINNYDELKYKTSL